MKRIVENIVFYLYLVFQPALLVGLMRERIQAAQLLKEASRTTLELKQSVEQSNSVLQSIHRTLDT